MAGTLVHEFKMGDVEDPDLYAQSAIFEQQQTPAGKYCMDNARIKWTRNADDYSYGHIYKLTAEFSTDQEKMIFLLKFA